MEQQGYRGPPGPAHHLPHQPSPHVSRRPCADREPELPAVHHADWRRELRGAILSRVMPRLSKADPRAEAAPAAVGAAQVDAFSAMLLSAAVPALLRHIGAQRADGLSVEAVVLQLMAPAARRLGDLWLDDRLSFVDVTAALGRLGGVMRALGPDFEGEAPRRLQTSPHGHPRPRKVLLCPVPGEQHVFGLSVVAAFFRRAGWDVSFEPRIAFDDLLERVRSERYAVVGLSVANDRLLPALPGQVAALRRASPDGGAIVLGGGPAFLLDPGLGDRAGVDAVARDAAEAVRIAEALTARSTRPDPSDPCAFPEHPEHLGDLESPEGSGDHEGGAAGARSLMTCV